MSEILRAILDRNCLDSRLAMYGAQISTTAAGGVVAYARRQVTIPCKADTHFLVMSAALDSAINLGAGAANNWQPKAAASFFQIVRANTGEAFSIAAQPTVLKNYNLNNLMTFDEYILFEPAELIQVNLDIRTNTVTAGAILWDFVTLLGVEYQMPEGRRAAANV
jgi:hypothetical protein